MRRLDSIPLLTLLLAGCEGVSAPESVTDATLDRESLHPATEVACGETITESVTLKADLTNCPGDGIVIGADNIVLNGNGHAIDGQGVGSGVLVLDQTGVTIKNLRVSDFSIGVSLGFANENTVTRNEFFDNNRGVRLGVSSSNKINQNRFENNFLAIRVLFDSNENRVSLNKVSGNGSNAISLLSSNGNVLIRNQVSDNPTHAVTLFQSSGNTVKGNTVSGGDGHGFLVLSSSGNRFIGNRSVENLWDGFSLDASTGNEFLENTAERNGMHGFEVTEPAGASKSNALVNNSATDNAGYGYLDTSSGGTGDSGTDNTYERNRCSNNVLGGSSPGGLCGPRDSDPSFPLRFVVEDPVADHTGSVDVVRMVFEFDDGTGDYEIVLRADEANPFVGSFRVNINLFNPDVGTTAQFPAFFQDALNDFSLGGTEQTELRLTGSDPALTNWGTGDRVFTNSLAGTGNPDGTSLFRSSVVDAAGGFLTNEDVIAFGDLSQPAVVQQR